MKKIVLLLTTVLMVSSANAALLFEPYLGYHVASEYKLDAFEADLSGAGVGARIGYQNLGFMAGLNLKRSTLDVKETSNFNVADSEVEVTQYGLFVGYNLPILFRFWAEYVIGGSAEFDGSGNTEFEKVSGTQLGIGYTGLPFVSLNLEVGNLEFSELKGSPSEPEVTTYMLSVSLPLTF